MFDALCRMQSKRSLSTYVRATTLHRCNSSSVPPLAPLLDEHIDKDQFFRYSHPNDSSMATPAFVRGPAFVSGPPLVSGRAALPSARSTTRPARTATRMVAPPLLRGVAAVVVGGAAVALMRLVFKSKKVVKPVTEDEVLAAQSAWSDAIVRISAAQAAGEDFVKVAGTAAAELYGYGDGDVLFKPTKATNNPFRPSAEDAMSYFVVSAAVGNIAFDGEDSGFAINGGRGWEKVVFRNHEIKLFGEVAHAMGEYYFKDATNGDVSRVEYTFGYKRCTDGNVRICLHHSSVPFAQKRPAVTEAEVLAAQKLWCDSIVAISKVYSEKGDFVGAAGEAAGKLYGYGHTDVLFKPTKATAHPFRPTAADAMSYFVGAEAMDNPKFEGEDAGFAINGGRGWSDVVFRNHKIDFNGSTAQAMGDYVFTDATSGDKVRVEYTFGYKRCADGKVRICLHHSSVPFEQKVPAVTGAEVLAG